MKFKEWIKLTEASMFSQVFQLRYGDVIEVDTKTVNKLVKHYGDKTIIPKNIGIEVVLRPADDVRGSYTVKMLDVNKYLITHNNDPIDADRARIDIPYTGTGVKKPRWPEPGWNNL